MIFAVAVHLRRKEASQVPINTAILLIAIFVAVERL